MTDPEKDRCPTCGYVGKPVLKRCDDPWHSAPVIDGTNEGEDMNG